MSQGYLIHSTGIWKEHKYIKKIGDRYYYKGENIPSGAEYGDYSKDDPDFSDENYDKSKRVGNTDFFRFTNSDGRTVLLEEDMKWVLPEGMSVTPELIKNLQNFTDSIPPLEERESGKWSHEKWLAVANRAINSAIHPRQNKSESRSLDEMAKAVIRGEYGNGKDRKEALGENYAEIQKRVNEMMKGGSSKSSDSKKSQMTPTAINAADRRIKHSAMNEDFLEHFGILGMHWGIRRYQNKDGSLTAAGKKRYDSDPSNDDKSKPNSNPNQQAANQSGGNQNQNNQNNNSRAQIRELQNQINELKQLVKQQNQQMQNQQQNSSKNELDELQNAVRRLELEKRYRELSQPPQQQTPQQSDRTKELEVMVRTMELEQRYNNLVSQKNQKKESTGKKFVKDILYKAGMAVGTAAATYALGTAVNKMMGQDVIKGAASGAAKAAAKDETKDNSNKVKNEPFKEEKKKTRKLFTNSSMKSARSGDALSRFSVSISHSMFTNHLYHITFAER